MTTPFRGYPRVGALAQPDGRGSVNALADAIDADVQLLSTGYRIADIVHYTSAGTFQKGLYADMRAVMVECIGAGGAAGYRAATIAGQSAYAFGGAGGAYTRSWFTEDDLLSSEVVTVGAGGVGGTSGTPTGGTGGASSFGALVEAGGGTGGGRFAAGVWGESENVGVAGGEPSGTYQIGIAGESTGAFQLNNDASIQNHGAFEGGAGGGPYSTPNRITVNVYWQSFLAFKAGLGVGGGARGSLVFGPGSAGDGADGADGMVIVSVFL